MVRGRGYDARMSKEMFRKSIGKNERGDITVIATGNSNRLTLQLEFRTPNEQRPDAKEIITVTPDECRLLWIC
jgi:hypothetical protein